MFYSHHGILAIFVAFNLALAASGFNLGANQGWVRNQKPAFAVKDTGADLGSADLDIDRAKDCADHFGKCSVDELEKLRDTLHQERLKTFVVGNAGTAPEEAFEHRLLEEELELQLSLLKEEMATDTLVHEIEETMDPNHEFHKHESIPEKSADVLIVESTKVMSMDEGILEAAAICGAIAVVIMAPQIFHV